MDRSSRSLILLTLFAVTLLACPQPPAKPPPLPELPPPTCEATLSETELDFGEVESGRSQFMPLSLDYSGMGSPEFSVLSSHPAFLVSPSSFTVTRGLHSFHVLFNPRDSRLHLGELIIRSEDGVCEFRVAVRGLGTGNLRMVPETLQFELNPGRSQTAEVFVLNSRREPVELFPEWQPQLGSPNPFTVTAPDGFTVPAFGTLRLVVTAAPATWTPANVQLKVASNPVTVRALIKQRPTSPRFEVSPLTIEIPRVRLDPTAPIPGFAARQIRVRNAGTTGDPAALRLRVERVLLVRGDERELQFTAPSDAGLAEGEWTEFTVRVTPRTAGPRSFLLSVAANSVSFDPVLVQLEANAEVLPPCFMQIDPLDMLQLNDAGDGGVEGTITFTNVTGERCIVDNPRLSSDTQAGFVIVAGAESQIELPLQGAHRFTIAGPKPWLDAGVVGSFGYHVFHPNQGEQWIQLWANP